MLQTGAYRFNSRRETEPLRSVVYFFWADGYAFEIMVGVKVGSQCVIRTRRLVAIADEKDRHAAETPRVCLLSPICPVF
jgi:hypothetical protein